MTATEAPTEAGWSEANQRHLSAALKLIRYRLRGELNTVEAQESARQRDAAVLEMSVAPALRLIERAFGLTPFERDILLLSAGVELDTEVAQACAEAHGDSGRPYVTFSLALKALEEPHWSALSPTGPLRRWSLVELAAPQQLTASPLRIGERVLHALTGLSYLDPRIEALSEPAHWLPDLPVSLTDLANRLAAHWVGPQSMPVVLYGRPAADLVSVAAMASRTVGLDLVRLRAAELPSTQYEQDELARLCERETALDGRSWVVDVSDLTGSVDSAGRVALNFAARTNAPVTVVSREQIADPAGRCVHLLAQRATFDEIRAAWHAALGADAASDSQPLADWVDRVASHFDLDLTAIASVVSRVQGSPRPTEPAGCGGEIWAACREHARPALAELTDRVEPAASWDDLILPQAQFEVLRQLAAQLRYRATVYERWGFGSRTTRGLGVAALFSGASGTGKTLAAEVLAAELSLDLCRVDLSQVVSKYIGETEKNLRRIFDAAEAGGVVLLFDEADALFGKRSEVKDSHDRYANIEVSYLLQRMENYRGLAILTTNFKGALDTAFLRRIRFIVHFPLPDAEQRAAIWRRIFPVSAPTQGLDPQLLAQLTIPGGTISNIALASAFFAAEAGRPIRMSDVLKAARAEYLKIDRPLTDSEVAGWQT
jgi:hypothetical protein